jgi:Mor family transcriptional regulator
MFKALPECSCGQKNLAGPASFPCDGADGFDAQHGRWRWGADGEMERVA